MRLRKDEIALPDGTVVSDYFVRESHGFVIVVALTPEDKVVLSNEYRYGADAIGVEFPSGTLQKGEDPVECARRELLEETGYAVESLDLLGTYYQEPVRSRARGHVFLGRGARNVAAPKLDATEYIETFEAGLNDLREMLKDARMNSFGCVAAAYIALEYLRRAL